MWRSSWASAVCAPGALWVSPPTSPQDCPLPCKSLVLLSVGAQQHRDQPQVSLEGTGTLVGKTVRKEPMGIPGIIRSLQERSGFRVTFAPPTLPPEERPC